MTVSILLLPLLLLTSSDPVSPDSGEVCPISTGITAEYGIGRLSLRDEYISEEKYSGTMPGFAAVWSRWHETQLYRLRIEYAQSDDITNNNVATDVYQFALNQGFLYPLGRTAVLSRDVFAFLGPTAEVFAFYNKPLIAVSGFDYAQSFAVLLSAGIGSEAICPLSHRFSVEGGINATLLSLGLRMVDEEEDDESAAKPLTFLAGTNASLTLGMRYEATDNLSMKVAYRLRLTRISSWAPLMSVSDNLVLSLTIGI